MRRYSAWRPATPYPWTLAGITNFLFEDCVESSRRRKRMSLSARVTIGADIQQAYAVESRVGSMDVRRHVSER